MFHNPSIFHVDLDEDILDIVAEAFGLDEYLDSLAHFIVYGGQPSEPQRPRMGFRGIRRATFC